MAKEISFEQFSNSQYAIQDYIHSDKKNWGTHEANVKVLENDILVFEQKLSIVSLIETNESFVEIIWPKNEEKIYYIKYSNKFQVFEYSNNMLEIKCENRSGKDIVIHIG